MRFLTVVPFITSKMVAKLLYPDKFYHSEKSERDKSYVSAAVILKTMTEKMKHIPIRLKKIHSHPNIYVRYGNQRKASTKHFAHEQALHTVLCNFFMQGYRVKAGALHGNRGGSDGIVWIDGEPYGIELDRHYSNYQQFVYQVMKYERIPVKKILFISYPQKVFMQTIGDECMEEQIEGEKRIRADIKKSIAPKEIRDKILVTTFIQVSDPREDPTRKIWRTLSGKYVTIKGG